MTNDKFTGKCRDLSAKGLGVFDSPDGRVVFVAGAWPGDYATITVSKWEKRYGFGRLVELHTASSNRQIPKCPYQGFDTNHCGGCPWMIGSYEDQLRYKQQVVAHFLERAGLDITSIDIKEVAPSPTQYGYRNRAQFKTDGNRLGFVAQGSNEIIDIEDCMVLTPKNRATLQSLRETLPNADWNASEGHPWVFIDIDEDIDAQSITMNKRRPFRQGNDFQNEYMKSWLDSKLRCFEKGSCIMELFCGSGNFTQVISSSGFKDIVAVEVGKSALHELNLKKLSSVRTFGCDLFKIGALNFIRKQATPRYLVLDPPRVGFRLLNDYCQSFPSLTDILYITCDIASFSYDINKICKNGWRLVEVQPVDQFPHTPHIEALAHLVKEV